MSNVTQHQPVPLSGTNDILHRRNLAVAINNLQQGQLNVSGTITLISNVATTTLTDARISAINWIGLMPTTADAATAYVAGIYFGSQNIGSVVLHHASSANTDQTFRYVIIG
jgi:hypothetical protein